MKKTSEFLHASPRMKPEMVIEGIQSASIAIAKLASEMKVLNGWLAVLPAYIACGKSQMPDAEKLDSVLNQYGANTDDLTEQVTIHAQYIDALLKYLEKTETKV